jgi:hypothetical protein
MRQWKIALSLAIVVAAAAPFAFHTYKMRYPEWRFWEPVTAVERQQITINLAHCTASEMSDEFSSCGHQRKYLDEGGFYAPAPSVVFYLLLNAAVAAASFGATFALTYLLPALIRRYWKWLNA